MRNFINIIESAGRDIDWVAEQLMEYIMHNMEIDDEAVGRALREHGYTEPHADISVVYRAFSLPIPNEDITCGELFERYASDPSWYRRDLGAQSCSPALSNIAQFLASEQHITGHGVFHDRDTRVQDIKSFYVIGEFSVAPNSVIWSVRGLKSMQQAEIQSMLRETLFEYGDVDEIKIRGAGLSPKGLIPSDKKISELFGW